MKKLVFYRAKCCLTSMPIQRPNAALFARDHSNRRIPGNPRRTTGGRVRSQNRSAAEEFRALERLTGANGTATYFCTSSRSIVRHRVRVDDTAPVIVDFGNISFGTEPRPTFL